MRTSIVREMEFRGNFFIGILRQLLWFSSFVLLIEVMFANTSSLAGWEKHEVLIILALSRAVEGFMGIFFVHNILSISDKVQKGQLDYILTKPLPVQFAAFFNRISLDSVGNFLAGIALLLYVITRYDLVNINQLLLAAAIIFLGIISYYSLLVCVASLVFYVERLHSLWSFNELFSEPLTVPFDIFPRGPRIALTYLIPIAFVVFVPAQALTGRLQLWQLPVAAAIALTFLTLANLAWRAGLRRYSSASS